eukprot:COSAG01_NODE_2700_length_7232_cov_3.028876_3_plen_223_part_00
MDGAPRWLALAPLPRSEGRQEAAAAQGELLLRCTATGGAAARRGAGGEAVIATTEPQSEPQPEPEPADLTTKELEKIRERLTAIFAAYRPAKVVLVDALLDEWRGREAVLLRQVEHKYLGYPVGGDGTAAGSRHRVTATDASGGGAYAALLAASGVGSHQRVGSARRRPGGGGAYGLHVGQEVAVRSLTLQGWTPGKITELELLAETRSVTVQYAGAPGVFG